MDIDGSNIRQLTDNNTFDGVPAWQPAAVGAGPAEPTPAPDSSE
jgi:hypothetical protein